MVIAKRFQLLDTIGSGGMATVHRARHRSVAGFERIVALKRMHPQLATRADFVERFIREARLVSALSHPNIVQIYDFGQSSTGFYIAMEHVEGCSLNSLMIAALAGGIAIPPGVVIAILRQLCEALEHVHTRTDDRGRPLGIVHRDISHGNLLLSRSGHLKVIDFGIAAELAATDGRTVAGKLAYMAPEVMRGEHVDARADLFAIGIVAWELLAGRALFAGGTDKATIDRVLRFEVAPPSTFSAGCPPELDHWVLHALAKNRDLRPRTAAAMCAGLEDIIRAHEIDASPSVIARWLSTSALQLLWQRSVERDEPDLEPETIRELIVIDNASTGASPARAPRPRSYVALPAVRPPGVHRRLPVVVASAVIASAVAAVLYLGAGTTASAATESAAHEQRSPVVTEPDLTSESVELAPTPRPPSPPPPVLVATAAEPAPERVEVSRPSSVVTESEARASTRRAHRRDRKLRDLVVQVERDMPRAALPRPDPPRGGTSHAVRAIESNDLELPTAPVVPSIGRPVMIPPDRVRKLAGDAVRLDGKRLEHDGLLDRRIAAVVCIDERGSVMSVRFLGRLPQWVTDRVGASVRRFRFTPYRVGAASQQACFVRQMRVARELP